MVFEWKEEYNLGIAEIDKQHREILEEMNELNDAILAKESQEELDGILSSVIETATAHFDYEEALFKKYGYADEKEHARHHKIFEARLANLRKMLEEKHKALADHLADFLEDWLKDHVLTQDKKFVEFFKGKGVK